VPNGGRPDSQKAITCLSVRTYVNPYFETSRLYGLPAVFGRILMLSKVKKSCTFLRKLSNPGRYLGHRQVRQRESSSKDSVFLCLTGNIADKYNVLNRGSTI
jgi:hypothetical protein